jgi:arylformamidase
MNEIIYKGFRKDELEYQYNPRESVPEYPQLSKRKAEQARKVRETVKSWLNVSYGSSARETLDIYAADKAGGPVLIYIPGGYWRTGTKEDSCNFVPTFTQRGATEVLVEYDLCPNVTVTGIVRQTRTAIAWVFKNITRYGGNPSNL